MQLLPLLIGFSVTLGVEYFCFDLYRNRKRLSARPNRVSDNLSSYSSLEVLDSHDLQAVGESASHCATDSVEHCVNAIAHSLSHH
jgi:hypothetical protein